MPDTQPRPDPYDRIEVDDNRDDDSDSAFVGSIGDASYTTSISESVRKYKYENGRRYHAFREGEYFLPNDESEQDRMDLLHHIYLLITGGKLYLSPIVNPQRVLDLGTGTGIWAMDFADEHTGAIIIGNDLSPIQPRWVPPNVRFEVDDFESDWTHSQKFDFIHCREIEGMVKDFDRLFVQTFENLVPGGWAEFQSIELKSFCDEESKKKAEAWWKWAAYYHDAARKLGKDKQTLRSWPERLKKAGFQNVKSVVYPLPLNPWPKDPKLKEIGRYQQMHMREGMVSYSLKLFTGVLNWKKEEVEALLADVQKVLVDRTCHLYTLVHFVYAQRPTTKI